MSWLDAQRVHHPVTLRLWRVQIAKLTSIWDGEKPESKFEPGIRSAFEMLAEEIPEKMLPVLQAVAQPTAHTDALNTCVVLQEHIFEPLNAWATELEELKDIVKVLPAADECCCVSCSLHKLHQHINSVGFSLLICTVLDVYSCSIRLHKLAVLCGAP